MIQGLSDRLWKTTVSLKKKKARRAHLSINGTAIQTACFGLALFPCSVFVQQNVCLSYRPKREKGRAREGEKKKSERERGEACVCFSQSRHCCVLQNGGGRPRALTKGVFVIWKKTLRAAAINVRPDVYYAITPQSHS